MLWTVGDVIDGRYEVMEVAGEGGMGQVLQVRHLQWGVDLAVKCPKVDWFKTAKQRERFVSEAEAWVSLGLHPNICGCHYVRVFDDGVPRVFAEYVSGGSLRDWIDKRRLYAGGPVVATTLILDLAVQIAWGLGHAHASGLIHQDVKPANVLLDVHDNDVTAKVTDFGLARARPVTAADTTLRNAPHEVSVPVAAGGMTRAYASPEQIRGEPLGRRTDIFSFAVSVLEMFTGGPRWRFGPEASAVLAAGIDDPDFPPIPSGLANLLERCLQADAATRPASMADVAGEIAKVYRQVTGRRYPRLEPQAADLRGDEFNNRALSLLDLDRPDDAEAAFASALTADPRHAEATYNYGLVRWRRGEITDEEVIADLEAVRTDTGDSWPARYVLGLVHLERGDVAAARPLLEGVDREQPSRPAVRTVLESLDSDAIADARCIGTREIRWCWTRPGWMEPFLEVDVSADGKRAVTGGVDDLVRAWDVLSGQCLHTMAGHTQGVQSVHITPDGRYAASIGGDKTVRIWDLADGTCLRSIRTRGLVLAGLSARAGILVGAAGGSLVVWDLRCRQIRWRLGGYPTKYIKVELSPDGRWAFATGYEDCVARLWDLENGQCRHVLPGESGINNADRSGMCFDVDAGVAAIGWSVRIGIWDLTSGRRVRMLDAPAASLALSSDGKRLLTGASLDGTVQLWDLESGRCLRTFRGHGDTAPQTRHGTIVPHVQWGANDQYALSAGQDNTVRLWRMPNTYAVPPQLSRPRQHRELSWLDEKVEALVGQAARQEAAGDRAAALTSLREAREIPGYERAPNVVAAWRTLGRSAVRTGLRAAWPVLSLAGNWGVSSFDVSSDGRIAASGGGDLRLWDLATGTCMRTITSPRYSEYSGVALVQLSMDGTRVMASCYDGSVHAWSIETGELLYTLDGERLIALGEVTPVLRPFGRWAASNTRGPQSTRFSADGRLALIGGTDHLFRFWDLERGVCLRTLAGHTGRVNSAWISGDGQLAATAAADRSVRLWDLATGRCLRVLLGHTSWVMDVTMSGDGRVVASAGGYEDRTIRIWDVATGDSLAVLDNPSGNANAVRFTPDGRYVVSGGTDSSTPRVWDIRSGQCLRAVETRGGVMCVAPTPDGDFILSSGGGGLQLWALDWDLDVR